MTKTLTITADFNESYGLQEWVKENIEIIKDKTGLELLSETTQSVHDGFTIKTKILDQTFLIKSDIEKSTEYDLGAIVVEAALQEVQGVIWLANDLESDLEKAYNWLGEALGNDFETYLIPIKIM